MGHGDIRKSNDQIFFWMFGPEHVQIHGDPANLAPIATETAKPEPNKLIYIEVVAHCEPSSPN